MPYPSPYEIEREKDMRKALAVAIAVIVMVVVTIIALVLTSSPRLTKDDEAYTYDYAGPDGTLTGVPYELRNYVVEDHDTGVYYFLILDPKTNNVTICPRFNADGTLWQNPLHVGMSE